MPDISPVYAQIAERTINILHTKCTRGIYAERMFNTIKNGSSKYYPLEKISWMKDFLEDKNQNMAACCLECLCSKGFDLEEAREILQKRLQDRFFSLKAIEIAEKLNNPSILLIYTEEDDLYINRVILALKNTKNESYLTTLMLSDNDTLVKSVNRIVDKK